jgi:hypothetical protein
MPYFESIPIKKMHIVNEYNVQHMYVPYLTNQFWIGTRTCTYQLYVRPADPTRAPRRHRCPKAERAAATWRAAPSACGQCLRFVVRVGSTISFLLFSSSSRRAPLPPAPPAMVIRLEFQVGDAHRRAVDGGATADEVASGRDGG